MDLRVAWGWDATAGYWICACEVACTTALSVAGPPTRKRVPPAWSWALAGETVNWPSCVAAVHHALRARFANSKTCPLFITTRTISPGSRP